MKVPPLQPKPVPDTSNAERPEVRAPSNRLRQSDDPHVTRGRRPGDHVEGPLSSDLVGMGFRLRLSSAGDHLVAFGIDDVTLVSTDATAVGGAQAPLHGVYRARRLRPGIYLTHWLNEERTAHVALVIDLSTKRVHVGAKLPGGVELFDEGTIEQLTTDEAAAAVRTSTAAYRVAASPSRRDTVSGAFTDDLAGITLGYTYARAGTFRIRYGAGTVSFGVPANPADPPPGMLTVPARARKLVDGLYLVHWFSPDPARTVHCVQVVDFAQNSVFIAALMIPGASEYFDLAQIALLTGRSGDVAPGATASGG